MSRGARDCGLGPELCSLMGAIVLAILDLFYAPFMLCVCVCVRSGLYLVPVNPWFGVFGHDKRSVPEGEQPAPMSPLRLVPCGALMEVCWWYGCCLNNYVCRDDQDK